MHLLERNAQQEFDDGSRPFVSNRVRVEMPADTLDEELLRALLMSQPFLELCVASLAISKGETE